MPNPISGLILYNAKLERTGKKTVDFKNKSAKDTFFGSTSSIATITHTIANNTYIRENENITVGINADVLKASGVNYCRFINPQFSQSRYIYCFIDDIIYKAPETSELIIRTDSFNTYSDAINFSECIVEREHVADDTPFKHYLSEPVSLGQTTRRRCVRLLGTALGKAITNYVCVFNLTGEIPDIPTYSDVALTQGGSISGTFWYACDPYAILKIVRYLDSIEPQVNILSISYVPRIAVHLDEYEIEIDGTNYSVYKIRDRVSTDSDYSATSNVNIFNGAITGTHAMANDITVDLSDLITDIKSKYNNCKLLTFPFMSIEFFTYSGNSVQVQPELFIGSNKKVNVYDVAVGGVNPSEIANIKSIGINGYNAIEYEQTYNNLPTIAVTQDTFSRYMAQHSNSLRAQKNIINREIGFSKINAATSLYNDVMGKNVLGAISDLENAARMYDERDQLDAQMADLKNAPDSVAGSQTDGTLLSLDQCGIFVTYRLQPDEIMKSADKYFDCYGYAVNTVKTPLILGEQTGSRPHYNYVKTVGCNCWGTIPQNELYKINALCDNGLTVWHMSYGASYGHFDGENNLASTR